MFEAAKFYHSKYELKKENIFDCNKKIYPFTTYLFIHFVSSFSMVFHSYILFHVQIYTDRIVSY